MNYNKTETDKTRLDRYMKLASGIKDKPVPNDLKESIWAELKHNIDSGSLTNQTRKVRPMYYSLAGLAAALAVLIILFTPETVETDYYIKAVKHGKGPVETIEYKKGQDPRADRILDYCDGLETEIAELEYIDDSPMVSSIILKIGRKDYGVFREVYNANSHAGFLPEAVSGLKPGKIRVQVYFPGRKYFCGDFNGDGYDDFGSCFTRDRKSSEFYISINDTEGRFLEAIPFVTGKTKLISRKDELLCGDINGDGYDDIIIKSSMEKNNRAVFNTFINNKKLQFFETDYSFPDISLSPLQESFCSDINGDRLDDLVVYNSRGEMAGRYIIALNTGPSGFSDPVEFETGLTIPDSTTKHKPVVMDINGDGLSDTGIYWQMGERNAHWYFSLTGKDMIGGSEFKARFGKGYMAFQGDYLVYTGDINNDGYDDLLVKAGTTDEISFWYHMRNEGEANFSSIGSLNFNGQEDIIVKED